MQLEGLPVLTAKVFVEVGDDVDEDVHDVGEQDDSCDLSHHDKDLLYARDGVQISIPNCRKGRYREVEGRKQPILTNLVIKLECSDEVVIFNVFGVG